MRTALLFFALLLSLPAVAADLVLIANPKSGITQLAKDDVVNIYLGRYRRLPSGTTAEPVDQPADSELRSRFYRQLVGKSTTEINAYWARLVFSGKTQPPQVSESAADAVRLVAKQTNALAYVERPQADSRVIVVFDWRSE